MVLNQDCVRDILLAVEKCPFNQTLNVSKLAAQLPDYDEDTIWYACLKMDEGGLLEVITAPMLRSVMPGIKQINCMTYQGHEFLDSVRENKHWSKAKDIAKKAGVFSLKTLMEIAQIVASSAVTAALQPRP